MKIDFCGYTVLYSEYVWNDELKVSEGNPRKKSQIEYRYQLFICYDEENYRLYISDIKKCGFVKAYFEEILGKSVERETEGRQACSKDGE